MELINNLEALKRFVESKHSDPDARFVAARIADAMREGKDAEASTSRMAALAKLFGISATQYDTERINEMHRQLRQAGKLFYARSPRADVAKLARRWAEYELDVFETWRAGEHGPPPDADPIALALYAAYIKNRCRVLGERQLRNILGNLADL